MLAGIACKQQCRPLKIVLVPDPPQWRAFGQLFDADHFYDALGHSRWKEARGQRVNRDAIATPAAREGAREVHHRPFASVIGNSLDVTGTSAQAGDRGKINDAAVFVGNHRACPDLLAEKKQRSDIQVHYLVPRLNGMILGWRPPGGARIVD